MARKLIDELFEKDREKRERARHWSADRGYDSSERIVNLYKGTVSCCCPATGKERTMAYRGFEQDRETLKYACPASTTVTAVRERPGVPGRKKLFAFPCR